MALSIRVKEVYPLDDLNLRVVFVNGITMLYDVKQLIPQFDVYAELIDNPLFNSVHIDCGGCGIAWNEDLDISECELWENGIEVERAV